MKHAVIVASVFLALSCDSVDDRGSCWASADCPAGQYCARTPDGNVCWSDAEPPVVSGVTVSCSTTPCRRDGVLRVEATASDGEELAGVEAFIDLDGGTRKVALTRSGAGWGADLPLRDWPFEAYSRPVIVGVVARDGARNESTAAASPVEVTRLRWEREVAPSIALTSPAVGDGGELVVGAANGKLHVFDDAGIPRRAPIAVGIAYHAGAPVIGIDAIWIASNDGNLYGVALDAGSVKTECGTGESIQTAPVLIGDGTRALAGSAAAVVAVASTTGLCSLTATAGPVRATPVATSSGEVLVASGSTMESFTLLANGALSANWTGVPPAPARPSLGGLVTAPLAADEHAIWSVSSTGNVQATELDATSTGMGSLGVGASGIAVLKDGNVILSQESGTLRRLDPLRSPAWNESAQLSGVPATPMVVSGQATQLIVPTSTGRLYAVRESDGGIAWSVKLSAAGAALQPANIYTPPGQPAGAVTSTAYVSGADGKLYAVIVDGQLDTAAPWPKAFHDPRNTNNAGTAP
ncbi:PQQ-binding-like beta-propeller repeat protein [Anaeromyxobacter sp. Fw109-5]|uniref:PQQ-binding-like beta-propeller repeat protein n=1 Tax=Anaeromyxobacter sp. (strain Fw109-5) TaxID=404589 RepID=UPI0000ED6E58|nr:PQQ-binding-like beta-propeller repeat protein [Anaeromyxobacter sp. Fw109-5]ABS28536.1 conserved hypothetical protein [Anaeromyxobacter sp. Fw109-5]